MLTLLAALTLAVAPPPGHLALGRTNAPLAISSYCWHGQCAAPLGASALVAVVPRRYPIRCDLGYTPTKATLTVGGRSATVTPTIDGVTWNAPIHIPQDDAMPTMQFVVRKARARIGQFPNSRRQRAPVSWREQARSNTPRDGGSQEVSISECQRGPRISLLRSDRKRLDQRFQSSNHIIRPCRACTSRCERRDRG